MKRPSKYLARKVVVDGREFDSAKEARRYGDLKLLERAGEISALEIQPKFPLKVNDRLVCTYKADFAYLTRAGARVVEDVKSEFTRKLPVYRIKVKLLKALTDISVVEV